MTELRRYNNETVMYVRTKIIECEAYGIRVPKEFFEFLDILIMGAKKYEPNGWIKQDGVNMDVKSNVRSMLHHLAEFSKGQKTDHESGLDPILHLQIRAGMARYRNAHNLKHPLDGRK